LLAPFILFGGALHFPILEWDDIEYISRNPWLYNLSWQNVIGVFRAPYFSNYHPLTMLSYMIDVHFWGHWPPGLRFPNLLLHGMTTVVAYVLLRQLAIRPWVALMLTLLFSVHPLRVESTIWISERKDVLCAFFYLLGILCWHHQRRGALAIIGYLLCLTLALLAKAMAVSLPLVVILYDLLILRVNPLRRWWVHGLALVLAATGMVLNMHAQERTIHSAPLDVRLGVAATAPWFYTFKTIWPANLAPLYPYEMRPSKSLIVTAATLIGCVATFVGALLLAKRHGVIAFSLLAAGVALGPVSGIVGFGAAFAADRYTYVPSLLLLPGLAVLAAQWADRSPRTSLAVSLLLIALYGAASTSYLPTWSASARLWERVSTIYPQSLRAKTNHLHGQRNEVAADLIGNKFDHLFEGETAAQNERLRDFTHSVYVMALLHEGKPAEALREAATMEEGAQRALVELTIHESEENFAEAAAAGRRVLQFPKDADYRVHARVALMMVMAGDEAEARAILDETWKPSVTGATALGILAWRAYEAGRRDDTVLAEAKRALAMHWSERNALSVAAEIFLARGDREEAIRILRRGGSHSLATDSSRHYAWRTLGRLLQDRSYIERASELEFRDVTDPLKRAESLNFAGWTAEEAGLLDRAFSLYLAAAALDPKNASALENLAVMHLKRGNVERGRMLLKRALLADPTSETIPAILSKLPATEPSTGATEAPAPDSPQ
jgi:tetratricopeptide (TPR) repeat protein